MKRYREYMINSVKYEYSNGPLEGFNNKIKLVKEVLMVIIVLIILGYAV